MVAVRRAYLSALLSFIGVGLGQFYNGDTLKGVAFFIGFITISFGIIVTPYQTALFYGIWFLAIIDAFFSTRRINRYERPFSGASYLLYAELAVLGLIVVLHVLTGEPDLKYMGKLSPSCQSVDGVRGKEQPHFGFP